MKWPLKLFVLVNVLIFGQLSFAGEAKECNKIISNIERLECFDHKYKTPAYIQVKGNESDNLQLISVMPIRVKQAYQIESNRSEEDSTALVSVENDSPDVVILTLPVENRQSSMSKPLIVMSCIENITRLEMVFPQEEVGGRMQPIDFKVDRLAPLRSNWFVSPTGYFMYAERGLYSIQLIRNWLNKKKLSVALRNSELEPFIFNLDGLEEKIVPLRKACSW